MDSTHDVIQSETGKRMLKTKPYEDSSTMNDTRGIVVRNSLIAGSCSGITSTLGLYPMDVLRTKMQQHTGSFHHGPFEIIRTTFHHGGIRAFYTGLTLPLLAQTVYKGTIFTISNMTQQSLIDYRTYLNKKNGRMERSTSQVFDTFVGGFVGGAVNALLFVTPVEFVRNQMIAHDTKRILLSASTAAATVSQSLGSNTIWDVIQHSIKQDRGIFSLWRGASLTVYRDAIGCGCFFYSMEYCQQLLTNRNEKPSFTSTVISGGIAGLAYWLVALPIDTIKTWVQSSDVSQSPLSIKKVIRDIYHETGITGVIQRLFRGWQVAYGRGIPSAAITMTTYSLVYRFLSSTSGTR